MEKRKDSKIQIRVATEDEFDFIYELWKKNKKMLWIPYRTEIHRYIKNKYLYILYLDGLPIGMGGYYFSKKYDNLSLIALCIVESYRRQGYGLKLVKFIYGLCSTLYPGYQVNLSAVEFAENNLFYDNFCDFLSRYDTKTSSYIVYSINKQKLEELDG